CSFRFSVRPKGHHRWCRAPRFIKKLSVELQEKIEAIWVGYKEGEECHQQKEATRAILETITEEEWKELRPRGGRGGHGGHGGRGRPFPRPVIETTTPV
uniref:Uncharacterized protein n=1 Tax=Plectus sambesii TaxID=2011161 RepID=A0A914W3I7_9BILA